MCAFLVGPEPHFAHVPARRAAAAGLTAVLAVSIALGLAPALVGAQSIELPAADRPLATEITDLLTLGTLEGGDWETFGQIRDVAFGPDGDLFILDQQAATVHRVSPDGEYRGAIGRQGDGPGEYGLPTGLHVGPDGQIAVRDTRRGSWAIFAPGGDYVDNLRPDGSLGRPSVLRFAPDGSLVGVPNDLLMVEGGRLRRTYLVAGGDDPDDTDRLPLVALDGDGGSPRVVGSLWIQPREVVDGSVRDAAFGLTPSWDVLPDGRLAVVDSTDWSVDVLGTHVGAADLRYVRDIEPQRVTDRMREREIERRAELPDRGRSGGVIAFGGTEESRGRALARAAEERLRRGLSFPETRPVVRRMWSDPEGRIWVARTPTSLDPDAPGPVDVLDASGRYLGTVPELVPPDAVGPGGLMAWIGTGELDVPIVTVRQVVLEG